MENPSPKNNKKKIISTTLAAGLAVNAMADKVAVQEINSDDLSGKPSRQKMEKNNYQEQAQKKLEQEIGGEIVTPEQLDLAQKDLAKTVKQQAKKMNQIPALRADMEQDYPAEVVTEAKQSTGVEQELSQLEEEAADAERAVDAAVDGIINGNEASQNSDGLGKMKRALEGEQGQEDKPVSPMFDYQRSRERLELDKEQEQSELIDWIEENPELSYSRDETGELIFSVGRLDVKTGSAISLLNERLANVENAIAYLGYTKTEDGLYVDEQGDKINQAKLSENEEGELKLRAAKKYMDTFLDEVTEPLTEEERAGFAKFAQHTVEQFSDFHQSYSDFFHKREKAREYLINKQSKLEGVYSKHRRPMNDPALKYLLEVNPELIPGELAAKLLGEKGDSFDWSQVDEDKKVNLRFALARNLYFQEGEELKVDRKNVIEAAQNLIEKREQFGSVEIFKDRNVLLFHTDEKVPTGNLISLGLFSESSSREQSQRLSDEDAFVAEDLRAQYRLFLEEKRGLCRKFSLFDGNIEGMSDIDLLSFNLDDKIKEEDKSSPEYLAFKQSEKSFVDFFNRVGEYSEANYLDTKIDANGLEQRIGQENPASLKRMLYKEKYSDKKEALVAQQEMLDMVRNAPPNVPLTVAVFFMDRRGMEQYPLV